MQQVKAIQVTIPNGQSLSNSVEIPWSERLVGVQFPGAWTAAALTFRASRDGATFGNVYSATGEYTIASASAVADGTVFLNPLDTLPLVHIQVRSGTAGSPVAQGGDRVITLLIRATD